MAGTVTSVTNTEIVHGHHDVEHDSWELELALLRRGVGELVAERVSCRDCHRTPLVGERIYRYDDGCCRCELCRAREQREPATFELVHGPEFGHSLRITDRRPAVARHAA